MKFVFSIVKYFSFFLIGALTCVITGTSTASYIAIDKITNSENSNIRDLSRIADSYVEELNLFDALISELNGKTTSSICATLCNDSSVDPQRLREERTHYLISYYKQKGAKALQDPLFRLTLDEITIISRIFSPSLRDVFTEVDQLKEAPSEAQKFLLALKAESQILSQVASLNFNFNKLTKEKQRINTLRKLRRSCLQGIPRKQITSECEAKI